MAAGTLPATVIRRPCMASLAIGVTGMIKGHVGPVCGVVAARALPWPMPAGRRVASGTICVPGMIKRHALPT
jgi:hypothetical protein